MTHLEFEAIANIAAVFLLFLAWFAGVKPAITRTFRQEMFKLRDELFDYMAAGNISADHQAYQLLRHRMNSYIRYADRMNFLGMLFVRPSSEEIKYVQAYLHHFDEVMDSLNPDQARKMCDLLNRAARNRDVFMLARSLFFCLGLLAILLIISAFARRKSRRINPFEKTKMAFDSDAALTV